MIVSIARRIDQGLSRPSVGTPGSQMTMCKADFDAASTTLPKTGDLHAGRRRSNGDAPLVTVDGVELSK